jgi:hypothetical protein
MGKDRKKETNGKDPEWSSGKHAGQLESAAKRPGHSRAWRHNTAVGMSESLESRAGDEGMAGWLKMACVRYGAYDRALVSKGKHFTEIRYQSGRSLIRRIWLHDGLRHLSKLSASSPRVVLTAEFCLGSKCQAHRSALTRSLIQVFLFNPPSHSRGDHRVKLVKITALGCGSRMSAADNVSANTAAFKSLTPPTFSRPSPCSKFCKY